MGSPLKCEPAGKPYHTPTKVKFTNLCTTLIKVEFSGKMVTLTDILMIIKQLFIRDLNS